MNNASDFVIKNGILIKYIGPGGDVVIPEGVTSIFDWAFSACGSLVSVTIPDTVTSIGCGAFRGCNNLKSVTIPESVAMIDWETFEDCSSLESVTIPHSVTCVRTNAFARCDSLHSLIVKNPSCAFENMVFGFPLPKGMTTQMEPILSHLSVEDIRDYVLTESVWNNLSTAVKVNLFMTRQGKPFDKTYRQLASREDVAAMGEAVLLSLKGKPSAKDCTRAFTFLSLVADKMAAEQAKALYSALKSVKTGAKAVANIEADPIIMELIGKPADADSAPLSVEDQVKRQLLVERRTEKDLAADFKTMYTLAFKDLPTVKYTDGSEVAPFVLAWLLSAHETIEMKPEYGKNVPVLAVAYQKPGIRPEAVEVLTGIDPASLQEALMTLADKLMEITGISKKRLLIYPICRYGDSATMAELMKRAPKWRSTTYGNDAPRLLDFRNAVIYHDSRDAILFAEKFGDFEKCAAVYGVTEDELRDHILSDVGLAPDGTKQYDLGTTVVTAELQPDFSFLFRLPDGKTAKSLPKKDADLKKYEAANLDFSEMKSSVKKIRRNRFSLLFKEFLSGVERPAEYWKTVYEQNPLLRHCATLVVWQQGSKTFILANNGPIDSDEHSYEITDEPIKVAHPMEMEPAEVTAWQKYFTSHGLKQPFAQVWEPVHTAAEIRRDRYAGCKIPYYFFEDQEKRGIFINIYDSGMKRQILFTDCFVDVEYPVQIFADYEIKSISFPYKKYTRQANHIVAYLDRITVWERVRKDDLSVVQLFDRFTLAQITEFIAAAQEANANNVLAALLDYKNAHFADFDPMAVFTLEW